MKKCLTVLSSLIGVGCSSPPRCADGFGMDVHGVCVPVGGTPSTDTASSAAYTPSEDTSTSTYTIPEAQWDLEAIQSAFEVQITENAPTPAPIFSLWRSMFAGRDSRCPGSDYNIEVPMGGCETSTGWRYTGPASYRVLDFADETAIILNADSHITNASGDTMIAAGTFVQAHRIVAGEPVQAVEMHGMIGYPPAETPWLQETMSADLKAASIEQDGGAHLDVSGGWSHGSSAITFQIDTPATCDLLTGTVGVRDPSGFWHAVTLDCSSCGKWTYGEQEQSMELCIDVSAFRAWLESLAVR